MGCGPTRTSVLNEIFEIIQKIKEENLELENQRDNLKLQQEMRSESDSGARDSINNLNSASSSLEYQIKNVKNMGVAFLPPTIPNVGLYTRINKFIEIQAELDGKEEIINGLRGEIDENFHEIAELDMEIAELQGRINEIKLISPSDRKQIDTEQNYYKEQIGRLTEEKQELLKELEEIEKLCTELTEEVQASEGESNMMEKQYSYEYLITLSDHQLKEETLKVEDEIEDLSGQFKLLKQKELELAIMSNNIDNMEKQSKLKAKTLGKQVEQAKQKIENLNREKRRLQEEIAKAKKEATSGLEINMHFLEKNLASPNGQKKNTFQTEEIEETLRKAKEITSSVARRNL